ncbi:hypothetical protein [Streptomyces olivaceus]|uniref:hypothetical protein n=1 Tax=Streptomyces olivaceus TaxID=47716 RepID=UPI0022ED5DC3|nr:hypothetical protein [Streptomyces olivaceus]GHI91715.1 hypothetical protein TPA0905_11860 [Streptomyces olivaceus]
MTVRPYPSAGRALRQILRRHRNEIPTALLGGREAAKRLKAGVAALPSAGGYVLSTRRR